MVCDRYTWKDSSGTRFAYICILMEIKPCPGKCCEKELQQVAKAKERNSAMDAISNLLKCIGKNNNNRLEVTTHYPIYCNLRKNESSQTPTDPYGKKGPLPPTSYRILPKPKDEGTYPAGTPSVTGFDQTTPGEIRPPKGTKRTVLRIHGPGLSEGCLACEWNADKLARWAMENHSGCGGSYLTVYEVGEASEDMISEFSHPADVQRWQSNTMKFNLN